MENRRTNKCPIISVDFTPKDICSPHPLAKYIQKSNVEEREETYPIRGIEHKIASHNLPAEREKTDQGKNVHDGLSICTSPKAIVCPPTKKQLNDVDFSLREHFDSCRLQNNSELCLRGVYYMVNSKWWCQWLDYASGIEIETPLPINNDTIAIKRMLNGQEVLVLNDDVKVEYASTTKPSVGVACCAVPEITWNALQSWFGGGPVVIYAVCCCILSSFFQKAYETETLFYRVI